MQAGCPTGPECSTTAACCTGLNAAFIFLASACQLNWLADSLQQLLSSQSTSWTSWQYLSATAGQVGC